MITFMLFIVAMVVYMFSVHGNDALVEENYYEKGINYDQQYNDKQNVVNDNAQPKISKGQYQLIIQLKDSANYELKLVRPSRKTDDVVKKGSTIGDANVIVIDSKNMPTGLWFMELKWTSKGRSYLFKQDIIL